MVTYYVSRMVIAAVLGYVLVVGGLVWWMGLMVASSVVAFFVLAPRSGRYVVRVQGGPIPLRRDERSQRIADKAGRNGFVATTLALGGLAIVYGSLLGRLVPVHALAAVLGLAVFVYAISDVGLRRPSRRRGKAEDRPAQV
jgi:hypothetical protein